MTHLVLVVVVGLPFSFCCFAINLISLFQSTKMPCSQFSQKVLRKVTNKRASFWSPFIIPVWLQLIATRWRSIQGISLAIWQPRKPYLISMPCIQPRYSYIRAKIHVLIFLFHLPAEKLESWETATHLNTSRCWSSHVAQKPPERCSNDWRSTGNCYTHHFSSFL